MKLLMCEKCEDIFNLGHKSKECSCGATKGRYLNNIEAEVSPNSISVAIGNGSFVRALARMYDLKRKTSNKATRRSYIKKARISHAWIRPNSGPGNPHTKIIESSDILTLKKFKRIPPYSIFDEGEDWIVIKFPYHRWTGYKSSHSELKHLLRDLMINQEYAIPKEKITEYVQCDKEVLEKYHDR